MKKRLDQLLTQDQLNTVLIILNETDDDLVRIRKLREFLQGFSADLEKKGVVAEYLAYVIEYHWTSLKNRNQRG